PRNARQKTVATRDLPTQRTHLTTIVARGTCRICNVLQPQSQSPIRPDCSASDRVLGATLRRAGMPEYKSTRILSAIAFVSLAGVFAQSTYAVRAAEECLSKPNSSAPAGEHWYYRMDRATGRQCWRLGPVGLHVQKTGTATDKRSAAAAPSET